MVLIAIYVDQFQEEDFQQMIPNDFICSKSAPQISLQRFLWILYQVFDDAMFAENSLNIWTSISRTLHYGLLKNEGMICYEDQSNHELFIVVVVFLNMELPKFQTCYCKVNKEEVFSLFTWYIHFTPNLCYIIHSFLCLHHDFECPKWQGNTLITCSNCSFNASSFNLLFYFYVGSFTENCIWLYL